MKFDFRRPMLDLDGEPIKGEDGKVFTLLAVCQNALGGGHLGETLSMADKLTRFALGLKIGEQIPQELTIDEVAEIRRLIDKAYVQPAIVGRACSMLEEKTAA